MPKTTKRTATKRAAKIAKAHATELPPLQVKQPKQPHRAPGSKRPARGLARYPWGIFMSIVIIGLGIFTLYYYHVGPFAQAKPKSVVVKPTPTLSLTLPNPSPCLKVVNQLTDKSPAPSPAEFKKIQHTYATAPSMFITTNRYYCAGINTNRGLIVVELDPQYAPATVNNFIYLAEAHFYDGLLFHRVIQTGSGLHIIQTGDPQGNGQGGPGYSFKDEPVKGNYTTGCVAMANSGPNTNGSQFFICTGDDTSLPKSYNLFGRIVQGMDVAQKIQGPGDAASTKNIKPDVVNHVVIVPAPSQ